MGFGFIAGAGLGVVTTAAVVIEVVVTPDWTSESTVPNLDWTPEAPL